MSLFPENSLVMRCFNLLFERMDKMTQKGHGGRETSPKAFLFSGMQSQLSMTLQGIKKFRPLGLNECMNT